MLVNGEFVKDWDKSRIGISYHPVWYRHAFLFGATAYSAIRRMQQDSIRYKWLCLEFIAGRERDIAEGLNSKEELDKYIDRKLIEEFGTALH